MNLFRLYLHTTTSTLETKHTILIPGKSGDDAKKAFKALLATAAGLKLQLDGEDVFFDLAVTKIAIKKVEKL